jgi:hypothetical protein
MTPLLANSPVLSCHRCLINIGVEKVNNIKILIGILTGATTFSIMTLSRMDLLGKVKIWQIGKVAKWHIGQLAQRQFVNMTS